MDKLPSTVHPLEKLCGPEGLGQALPSHRKSASIMVWFCQSSHPREVFLCLQVTQLAPPALRRCCAPAEQPSSTTHPLEDL